MRRWDGITFVGLAFTLVGGAVLWWLVGVAEQAPQNNLIGLAIINVVLALVLGPFAVTLVRLLSPPGARGLPRTHLAICGGAFLVMVVNAALVQLS